MEVKFPLTEEISLKEETLAVGPKPWPKHTREHVTENDRTSLGCIHNVWQKWGAGEIVFHQKRFSTSPTSTLETLAVPQANK